MARELEEDTETIIHRSKRLRHAGSLNTAKSLGLAGSNTGDPVPSPQSSHRPESGGLGPSVGGDEDEPPISSAGGGGEMTQDESLLEGQAPLVDPIGEPLEKPSKTTQGVAATAATAATEDGVHGPVAATS